MGSTVGGAGRSLRLVLAVLLALALGVVTPAAAHAACGGWLAAIGLQPDCGYTPPPPAPDPGGSDSPDRPIPVPGKVFGFSSGLYLGGMGRAEQELDAAKAAGANVHRAGITWKQLQPTPSSPLPTATDSVHPDSAIGRIDRFYAAAQVRNIQLIFTVGSAPLWATRYDRCRLLDFGCRQIARSDHWLPPDGPFLDEWQAFVRAVKARWPRAIVEPWNEPDLYWGHPEFRGSRAFAAEPERFKQIQCAAYAGSKSVNGGPVLAAGWSMTHGGAYVHRVYAAGGASCWDLANVHAYPAEQTQFGTNSALAQALHPLRQVRQRYGDSDPIWVTETGYTNTGGFAVSEATQSEASGWLYNRLVTMPDVAGVLFHTLRDAPVAAFRDSGHAEYGYGFLYEDWSPKPVHCRFTARAGRPAC